MKTNTRALKLTRQVFFCYFATVIRLVEKHVDADVIVKYLKSHRLKGLSDFAEFDHYGYKRVILSETKKYRNR